MRRRNSLERCFDLVRAPFTLDFIQLINKNKKRSSNFNTRSTKKIPVVGSKFAYLLHNDIDLS